MQFEAALSLYYQGETPDPSNLPHFILPNVTELPPLSIDPTSREVESFQLMSYMTIEWKA